MVLIRSTLRWQQRVVIVSAAVFVAGVAYKILQAEHDAGTRDLSQWEVWGGTALVFIVTKLVLGALVQAFWRKVRDVLASIQRPPSP